MRSGVDVLAAAAVTVVAATTLATAPAAVAHVPVVRAGPWVLVASRAVPQAHAGQGSATVTVPGGVAHLVTRGNADVPSVLRRRGWAHVGDPGAVGSTLVDAYQHTARNAHATLFVLTSPGGGRTLLVHRLAPGETWHNSFAAPAPGGRWFVGGGWGTERYLTVFPLPPAEGGTHALPTAGAIVLSRPVRDVQGCAFTAPTSLVCSTNDPATDLFARPRQLLAITLTHPLDGTPVRGTPALLGEVPRQQLCPGGSGEVEGLDVTGHRLVVAVNSRCATTTQLFEYSDTPAARADPDPPTLWSTHGEPLLDDPAARWRQFVAAQWAATYAADSDSVS